MGRTTACLSNFSRGHTGAPTEKKSLNALRDRQVGGGEATHDTILNNMVREGTSAKFRSIQSQGDDGEGNKIKTKKKHTHRKWGDLGLTLLI